MRKKNVKKDNTVVIQNIPSKIFLWEYISFFRTFFINLKKGKTVLIQNVPRKTFLSENLNFFKILLSYRFLIKYNVPLLM